MLSVREFYYKDKENECIHDWCCPDDWCNTKNGVIPPHNPNFCCPIICDGSDDGVDDGEQVVEALSGVTLALEAICDKLGIITGETVQNLIVDTLCMVDCLPNGTFVFFTRYIDEYGNCSKDELADKSLYTPIGNVKYCHELEKLCTPAFHSTAITESGTYEFDILYNNITIDNQSNACDLIVTLLGDLDGNNMYIVKCGTAKNLSFDCPIIEGVEIEIPADCECDMNVQIDLTKTL